MSDAQRTAEWVEAELIYGTAPSLIATLVSENNPFVTVAHVVGMLSRCGHNATATKLYNADQARNGADA